MDKWRLPVNFLYSGNQFVMCKEKFLEVNDLHRQQFHFERKHGNNPIRVVRNRTDVRVHENVRHKNANVKYLAEWFCISKCHGSSTYDDK